MPTTKLYDATLYHLNVLTNLHVGNGEINYSVIDKQVQRDPITGLPTINASSLKGALREYTLYANLKKGNGTNGNNLSKSIVFDVFGSSPVESAEKSGAEGVSDDADDPDQTTSKSKNNLPKPKSKPGYVLFHDARLLSLPARCDKVPYLRATSIEVLKEYNKYLEQFGLDEQKIDIENIDTGYTYDRNNLMIEDWSNYLKVDADDNLKQLLGKNYVVLEDQHFRTLADELPFVARNYLEDGRSENLWYEEIVPRESLFYFVLQSPVDDLMAYKTSIYPQKDQKVANHIKQFLEQLDESSLHIGANTSVGYGLCSIKAISTINPDITDIADKDKAIL